MKRYYDKEGVCVACGYPTRVIVRREQLDRNRSSYYVESECCEGESVLGDDGKEIMLRDLEEAGYDG